MKNAPGDAYDDPEHNSNLEGEPEAEVEAAYAEPDNTLEIIGAAIGGILLILAGVFQSADHNVAALWTLFVALFCYVASLGSWLRDRNRLPNPISGNLLGTIGVLVFICYFPFHYFEQEIRRNDAKTEQWEKSVGDRLVTLGSQVEDTQSRIAEQQRRRKLTPEQKSEITKAITPFAGQKINFQHPIGDDEASRYALEFAQVFRDAGWECGAVKGWMFPSQFENAVVLASKKGPEGSNGTPNPPKAYQPLVKILLSLGLSDHAGNDPATTVLHIDELAADEIQLRVGTKPPPNLPALDGESPNKSP